jgi:hypothetical protein
MATINITPPIGLVPKFVRDQERAREILAAMDRFVAADKKIPRAWVDELIQLNLVEG